MGKRPLKVHSNLPPHHKTVSDSMLACIKGGVVRVGQPVLRNVTSFTKAMSTSKEFVWKRQRPHYNIHVHHTFRRQASTSPVWLPLLSVQL